MSEQDFQDLLIAIQRFDSENSTSEAARKILQEEGVLNGNGEIAPPYVREAA